MTLDSFNSSQLYPDCSVKQCSVGANLIPGKMMGVAADLVREACQVIWTEGDASRVAEFYSADFEADYPMTDWGEGLPGVAALARKCREDLPGYGEEIEELIEAGEEVVVRLRIFGNHPQTGEPISFRDMTMLTVKNGKITKQRGLTDYLSLFMQLGIIDPANLSQSG